MYAAFIPMVAATTSVLQSSAPDAAVDMCPACTSALGAEATAVPDHEYGLGYVARYAECAGCGTLSQRPMPSFAQLSEFYPADYHSLVHDGRIIRARNAMRIRRLGRLAKLAGTAGPILDYGCGDGSFLLQAAEHLPRATFWGYEIAAKAEVQALANGRVTIVRGAPDDLFTKLPQCGLITLNHVIEHLPDPPSIVRLLTDHLLPGGAFEGQTPAADSLEHRVFGTYWSGFHAPRHTVIFSRLGLQRMLERCGLRDVSTSGAFNPAALAISIGAIGHSGPQRIRRQGMKWLALLGIAAGLAPIDLLSGRPGVMDFIGYKGRG